MPAPLSPTMLVIAGRLERRRSAALEAAQRPAPRRRRRDIASDVEPDRHHEVAVGPRRRPAAAGPGRSGEIRRSRSSSPSHALDPVLEEVRVEADLAAARPRTPPASSRVASPTSGVSAATVSSPSASASRSGALRWASWLTRRVTSSSSSRGQAHVVLVGLGQELAVVGELAVDQPRVEDHRRRRGRAPGWAAARPRPPRPPRASRIRPSSRSARAGTLASSSPPISPSTSSA